MQGSQPRDKKSLLELVRLALLARFVLAHGSVTVCSTSGLDEKIKRNAENRKHMRSCNEFSELNSPSIESSDSAQHNEGDQETRGTGEPGQTNGHQKKISMCQSSSVRRVAFLLA